MRNTKHITNFNEVLQQTLIRWVKRKCCKIWAKKKLNERACSHFTQYACPNESLDSKSTSLNVDFGFNLELIFIIWTCITPSFCMANFSQLKAWTHYQKANWSAVRRRLFGERVDKCRKISEKHSECLKKC